VRLAKAYVEVWVLSFLENPLERVKTTDIGLVLWMLPLIFDQVERVNGKAMGVNVALLLSISLFLRISRSS
jgi:hypothetical protein